MTYGVLLYYHATNVHEKRDFTKQTHKNVQPGEVENLQKRIKSTIFVIDIHVLEAQSKLIIDVNMWT
ncbi:hypothetical protein FACS1894162_8460 [Bacteroidia bacterium]|nr:hypothetical protein FACS1894162_8460 [Bacteroidia bacterium]